jgi:hypothetical protein
LIKLISIFLFTLIFSVNCSKESIDFNLKANSNQVSTYERALFEIKKIVQILSLIFVIHPQQSLKPIQLKSSIVLVSCKFHIYNYCYNFTLNRNFHFFYIRIRVLLIIELADPEYSIKFIHSGIGDIVGVPDGHINV